MSDAISKRAPDASFAPDGSAARQVRGSPPDETARPDLAALKKAPGPGIAGFPS
jgi:hypothetical protein